MLAETSGLTSSEVASVLATSGTTGAEGESSGNSWRFNDLVVVFGQHWRELEGSLLLWTSFTCLVSWKLQTTMLNAVLRARFCVVQ